MQDAHTCLSSKYLTQLPEMFVVVIKTTESAVCRTHDIEQLRYFLLIHSCSLNRASFELISKIDLIWPPLSRNRGISLND